jgi:TRAP-type C4-dicarboxylate transport system permease small subunit
VNALPNDPRDLLQSARVHGAARAQVVNRTHRVVREQALVMREQQSRKRSLWAPVIICSSMLLIICYAVWGMMDGYDLTPTGIPDASDQMMILVLWSLPVTAVALGLVWLRRGRNRATNGEVTR